MLLLVFLFLPGANTGIHWSSLNLLSTHCSVLWCMIQKCIPYVVLAGYTINNTNWTWKAIYSNPSCFLLAESTYNFGSEATPATVVLPTHTLVWQLQGPTCQTGKCSFFSQPPVLGWELTFRACGWHPVLPRMGRGGWADRGLPGIPVSCGWVLITWKFFFPPGLLLQLVWTSPLPASQAKWRLFCKTQPILVVHFWGTVHC